MFKSLSTIQFQNSNQLTMIPEKNKTNMSTVFGVSGYLLLSGLLRQMIPWDLTRFCAAANFKAIVVSSPLGIVDSNKDEASPFPTTSVHTES